MKKLLEISAPCECIHRQTEFTSRNLVTGERNIEGYSCGHPKCTAKYLKEIGKDFLPCNTKGFPKYCLLSNYEASEPLIITTKKCHSNPNDCTAVCCNGCRKYY